jgi:hypothetical protein
VATFDNASKAGDGVRAAANWLQSLSERSTKAATGAAARAATGRGVEGAAKLAARGVDDAHLAFRDVLHTVEGQDVFRGLTPEAQNKIIANATETNRLLAEELKQVQATEPGTQVRTFSARDSDAPSPEDVLRRIHGMRQELAPVSKTYDTQPTPKEMGERRRLASPTAKTTMRDSKTGETFVQEDKTPRPSKDSWLERIERDTEGDLQTRTALPEVPGGDLLKVQEIKPTRYASDMKKTLDATVNPQEINDLLAEVMTAHLNNPNAGILQPDELRALAPHFKSLSEKKKGEPEDQLTLDSVAKVVDSAITRMRGKTDLSEAEASLREKGLAWQANQTLYKPGTNELRREASLEPRDKSNLRVAQDQAAPFLGTGVTSAPDAKVSRQIGGEAVVDGDQPLPSSSGRSSGSAASKQTRRVLETTQRKRAPLALHTMTEDNPDGTLKYPQQALQTALEDVSRLEENTNWHSFDAAVARSLDYINAQRKASGLPPARLGAEMDSYLRQKSTAVQSRIEGDGASPTGDSVVERDAYSKRIHAALDGIRKGLSQTESKNPVTFDSVVRDEDGNVKYFTFPNQARAVDPATMSPVPSSNPAGEVMPGTARDPSKVPAAPTTVQPKKLPVQAKHPNARPDATDADISTDKHIADVVAGTKQPTEALVEAVQARQSAIDAKRMRGDGVGADADQKALDAQTAGWNWKGTEAPAPKTGESEALPEVPASIDLGTPKKGRQRKPKAEKPAAEEVPATAPEPAKQEVTPAATAPAAPTTAAPAPAAATATAEPTKPAAQPPARPKKTTDATPVAPPAAAKPEPAKVPASRETMELAAKQMGMTPEEVAGMDDPSLYKRLTEKASSGQEPFKSADPRFVKRKYSTGVVEDGDNLPDVPSQKVLDAGTRGELIPYTGPTGDDIAQATLRDMRAQEASRTPVETRDFNNSQDALQAEIEAVRNSRPKPNEPNWQMPKEPSTLPKPVEEPTVPKVEATASKTSTPADDAELARAEKFARKTAIGVGATTATGIVIANARRRQGEQQNPNDILGPTYHPQPGETKHPLPGSGGRQDQVGSDAPAPAAQAAPADSAMTDAPREQQDVAALEAMKAEQVRQEIAARRAAVESTLKRIGNVRGMGTYGPAFY